MGKKTEVSIGNKYFKLTVVEQVGRDKHYNLLWKCKCDCGNEVIVKSTSLTMKARPTKSCGCYWKEIHQLESGKAVSNALYRRYIKRDLDKKRISDLSLESFLRLTKGPCHYCGRKPSQKLSFKSTNGEYEYNGLDRLDSSLGYTEKNSVPCCKKCNYMKDDLNYQEFVDQIEAIYNYTVSDILPSGE